MSNTAPVCWVCQEAALSSPRGRVWITSDESLPICRVCWEKLPEVERARFALAYQHRQDWAELRALLACLLKRHAGECDEDDDDDFGTWLNSPTRN